MSGGTANEPDPPGDSDPVKAYVAVGDGSKPNKNVTWSPTSKFPLCEAVPEVLSNHVEPLSAAHPLDSANACPPPVMTRPRQAAPTTAALRARQNRRTSRRENVDKHDYSPRVIEIPAIGRRSRTTTRHGNRKAAQSQGENTRYPSAPTNVRRQTRRQIRYNTGYNYGQFRLRLDALQRSRHCASDSIHAEQFARDRGRTDATQLPCTRAVRVVEPTRQSGAKASRDPRPTMAK